jgi:hypothetical protein
MDETVRARGSERLILKIWVLGSLALLTAASGARAVEQTGQTGKPPEHSTLQGTWRLNQDMTDNLRYHSRDAREGQGAPPGGMRRPGGEGGRGGRRGGMRPEGRPDGPEGGPPGEPLCAGLETLSITESQPAVTILDAAGHQRTLRADGRTIQAAQDESLPGGPAQVRAWWDGDRLMVETKGKEMTRTESYRVTGDGKHLFLLVQMEPKGRRAFQVVRAYDAAVPGQAAPSPPS